MARSECHQQHEDCHVRPFVYPATKLALALTASFLLNACSSTSHFNPSDAFSPLDSAIKATSIMERGLSASRLDHIAMQLDHVLKNAQTVAEPKKKQSSAVLVDAIASAMGHEQHKIKPAVDQISKSAKAHDVPPALLASLIQRESGFKQGLVSSAGAVGLSQILPRVWSKHCTALRTIPGNVDCGAKVLRHYYDDGGSWEKALAYYNVGPGAYQKSARSRATGYNFARQVIRGQGRIETQLAQLEQKSPR